MSSLLFTRGLNAPQTLPGPVTSGDTTLALPNADAFFSPGELLFIGEADGSQAEFLGSVSAVDAASITFTLPVITARPAGASLFTPAESLRSTARLDPPLRRMIHTGVHAQRTLGGQVVSIRAGEPNSELELSLTGLTPDEEERLLDWIDSATDQARLPFTIVSASRRILALQVSNGAITRTATAGGRRAVAFSAFDLGENLVV